MFCHNSMLLPQLSPAPAVPARPRHLQVCAARRRTTSLGAVLKGDHLPSFQLPNGLTVRHTSTPAEVMFLYDEIYQQQQYLQQGVTLRQGGTVLDVGANIGLFSMLAAEVVGPSGCVLCVEPAPQTAAALALNLQQHAQWCHQQGKQVARSLVLPVAVTDDPSAAEAQFTFYKGAAGWSSLTPDDAEVVANMQYYVRSVLQPTADVQPGRDHSSHGWSLPQQALVWCARQLVCVPGAKGLTDAMTAAYVRLAMLRGAETVTVPAATVSSIIEEHQLRCVDLLKVDVERAELQVLQGIQQEHWASIQQVAMEVHDIDGRLSTVVSLLQRQGFTSVTTQQPSHLQGTDLHNLYATRGGAEAASSSC